MAWITWGDVVDLTHKIRSRGWRYLAMKLKLSSQKRVQATWDATGDAVANWWHIPAVKARWNEKMTGDATMPYETYLAINYLAPRPSGRVLSIGCGNGSHEIKLAQQPGVTHVTGIDLAPKKIEEAQRLAAEAGLTNTTFLSGDLFTHDLGQHAFDMVLFNSSLHHFHQLENILQQKVPEWLTADGLLVLFEFVGATRFQWPTAQLQAANNVLQSIPEKYRTKIRSGTAKKRIYRPGTWRMRINDPSESIRSADIMPLVHQWYDTVEEKQVAGSLLQLVFQDIAHHFVDPDEEAQQWLHYAFEQEDTYTEHTGQSDFIFGVYRWSS